MVFEKLSLYSIKLYIALSICLLFISRLQLINRAKFLNITTLFILSAFHPVIVILPLKSIYSLL